jgi:hypothetical protein
MRVLSVVALSLLHGLALAAEAEPTLTCPAGIGASDGEAPKAIFDVGSQVSLLLCGAVDSNPSLGPYFTEFELVDARDRSVVLQFGALDYATARRVEDRLEITEYRAYPLGDDFTFLDVPYRKFTVTARSTSPAAACELLFRKPEFTPAKLERLREMYEESMHKKERSEALAMLVVLAAMGGAVDFEARVDTAARELGLDGPSLEAFDSVMRDLSEVRSGRCALNDS